MQVREHGTVIAGDIRREVALRWSWGFRECEGFSLLPVCAKFSDDYGMISLGKLVD